MRVEKQILIFLDCRYCGKTEKAWFDAESLHYLSDGDHVNHMCEFCHDAYVEGGLAGLANSRGKDHIE
jgi:hypothetical protein